MYIYVSISETKAESVCLKFLLSNQSSVLMLLNHSHKSWSTGSEELDEIEELVRSLNTEILDLDMICRYVATDIPSDFLVQIGGANFHLHKVAIVFSPFLSNLYCCGLLVLLNSSDLFLPLSGESILFFLEVES